MLKQL